MCRRQITAIVHVLLVCSKNILPLARSLETSQVAKAKVRIHSDTLALTATQRRPRVALLSKCSPFYLRLWLSLCCLFDHSCIYNYTPFTFCLYACTEIVHMHNSELITDVNQSKARDVCMHFNAFPQYCSCFNRVLCSRVRRLQSRSWRCLCDTFIFELAT